MVLKELTVQKDTRAPLDSQENQAKEEHQVYRVH